MSNLTFLRGDLFALPVDCRINPVNCVGVMGKGLALQFKLRYPAMFASYQEACRAGRLRPGQLHIWQAPDGTRIINFPTKRRWREPSRYEDIEAGLNALRSYLEGQGTVRVAVPPLGCGLGSLNWDRVKAMIQRKLEGLPAQILVFER